MGVYIKGMEMPKCCDSCEFYDIVLGEKPFCALTTKNGVAGGFNPRKERMIDCPLVEVKTPHGRLIDADELCLTGWWIKSTPTIIEAEGKDDEVD